MAHAMMEDMVDFEYYAPYDSECFRNPNSNETVSTLNNIIRRMIVNDNYDDNIDSLTFVATNNYKMDQNVLGRNVSPELYEEKKSQMGLRIYTVIDTNDPRRYYRDVDARGSISPIDNSQKSYVAIPLVYTGKDPERRLDPFNYDQKDGPDCYSLLYPPQWEVIRRNYPEYKSLIDTEITKRHASYFHNKMYYSEDKKCWVKCGVGRARDLVEHITNKYYNKYIKGPVLNSQNAEQNR